MSVISLVIGDTSVAITNRRNLDVGITQNNSNNDNKQHLQSTYSGLGIGLNALNIFTPL